MTPALPVVDSPRSRGKIHGVTSSEACREKFRAHLAGRGLRVTGQRMAIFDAAFRQTEHFTAEDLLARAREIDQSVSRATIYRTLPLLIQSGLLREVDVGKDNKFYLPCPDKATQQAQIICLDCDRIFEISAPFMEWYGSSVTSRLGLEPVSQRLQVNAHCTAFRKTGSCPNKT